jgi:hypothetical protein
MPSYDIIGDIHGQADKLEQLLESLGYVQSDGVYQYEDGGPETSQAVFVGDFIDGNLSNRRVLDIVRPMVEVGYARAVMGNHEFNAICYHSQHPETGAPLRPHSDKNARQHAEFLTEYPLESADTLEIIDWFKTLPLFLELPTSAGLNVYEVDDDSEQPERIQFADRIRVVHACWDQRWVDYVTGRLGEAAVMDDAFLREAAQEGTEAFEAIETLLKGREIPLPDGASFFDHQRNERRKIRVTWWKAGRTYRDAALVQRDQRDAVPDIPIPDHLCWQAYPDDAPPVFFGHYWMTGEPRAQRHNVACLDYSASRNGPLVGYMWMDGGSQLGGGRLRDERFASSDLSGSEESNATAYSEQQLRAAWEAAKDGDQLRSSELFGCFYCQSVFDGEEFNYEGGWPECPRCGMEYVIGSDSGLPIERRFLAAVKDFWLEPPFPDEPDGA